MPFKNYFLEAPGKEHYRLLSYISTLYNGVTILDIGTYKGCSALALSFNPSNKVVSFDRGFRVSGFVLLNLYYVFFIYALEDIS